MASDPRRPDDDRADEPTTPEDAQDGASQEAEPRHELTFGGRRPSPSERSAPPSESIRPGVDLAEVEARCRAKAGAARRAADRQRRPFEQAGTTPGVDLEDPEIADWAERLTDGYYWREADGSQPGGISLLDDVGGCFEAVAEALALVADAGGSRGRIEKALPLLAEAQSALRAALGKFRIPEDPDQLAAYECVRQAAARHRVFLKRSMRADDLADPSGWPGLLDRIGTLTGEDRQSRRRRSWIERLRRHLEAIREGRGSENDWQAVVRTVDEMVSEGVPPSDREVRDLLLPVVDDRPDPGEAPAGFRLVLREIDRFLATEVPSPVPSADPGPTAEVREVARLLGGRSAVLIGGDRRPGAREALVEALGLRELVWIETKEHQAVGAFEPAIARPDVAVVLLAIRWSSHSFGDVKQSCDRHGKPLVRLPGGYGVNQVAAQIIGQCGERLRGGGPDQIKHPRFDA